MARPGFVVDRPYASLDLEIEPKAFLDSSNSFQCQISVQDLSGKIIPASMIRCDSEECRGRSFGEKLPCGKKLKLDMIGFWNEVSLWNSTVLVKVEGSAGLGRKVSSDTSLWFSDSIFGLDHEVKTEIVEARGKTYKEAVDCFEGGVVLRQPVDSLYLPTKALKLKLNFGFGDAESPLAKCKEYWSDGISVFSPYGRYVINSFRLIEDGRLPQNLIGYSANPHAFIGETPIFRTETGFVFLNGNKWEDFTRYLPSDLPKFFLLFNKGRDLIIVSDRKVPLYSTRSLSHWEKLKGTEYVNEDLYYPASRNYCGTQPGDFFNFEAVSSTGECIVSSVIKEDSVHSLTVSTYDWRTREHKKLFSTKIYCDQVDSGILLGLLESRSEFVAHCNRSVTAFVYPLVESSLEVAPSRTIQTFDGFKPSSPISLSQKRHFSFNFIYYELNFADLMFISESNLSFGSISSYGLPFMITEKKGLLQEGILPTHY